MRSTVWWIPLAAAMPENTTGRPIVMSSAANTGAMSATRPSAAAVAKHTRIPQREVTI